MKRKEEFNFLNYKSNIDTGEELQVWHYFCFDFIKKHLSGKKILNIGCWTGGLEFFLNDFPCEAFAVDIEERALEIARNKYKKINFSLGSADKLPFADNEFDVATIFFVIEHLPHGKDLPALQEINRIMKNGGLLFLSVPAGNAISRIVDPAYFLGRHRHYSEKKMEKMLKNSNFSIVEKKYRGGFFNTSKMMLFYFYKFVLRRPLPKNLWLENKIKEEFSREGYDGIYVMAQKNK